MLYSLPRSASLLILLVAACSAANEPSPAEDDIDSGVDNSSSGGSSGASSSGGEPSEQQHARARELEEVVEYVRANTAYPYPLDYAQLVSDGRAAILTGADDDETYLRALYQVFLGVPQGHQYFGLNAGCGERIPFQSYSRRGVCGRPHARGIIVTSARAGNQLGLKPGDIVRSIGGDSALFETLRARPMCAISMPSPDSEHGMLAATFADLVKPGEILQVEAASGESRDVTVVVEEGNQFADCTDPLGRPKERAVYSERRADGVGVIRLPSFLDPEQIPPDDPAEIAAYVEAFEAKIQVAFDALADAPALIWDIRGNGGGATPVGLDIASGFVGADATPLSYCVTRNTNSDPPSYGSARSVEYRLSPGGRFAYSGRVAVLTDQLAYSAGDYFPLAVKLRTNALLVGATTSGAFGASSMPRDFAGPPAFSVAVDINKCVNVDGQPLETHGVEPTEIVDYTPADLAAGRDTILERAAQLLTTP